jgi:hypothetical protein
MNKKEIGGAIERTALTAIDTGTSIVIHSATSAAVSFYTYKTNTEKVQRLGLYNRLRGDAIGAV